MLLVANKYQTGFDQPLLCAMYVDKRLDGVQAVQTLSRLNRMIPGKDAPFVLDFVNDAEDIFRAFKPYYDKTDLAEPSDPSSLEALKHELDQEQVYHWSEVEAFAQVFYKPNRIARVPPTMPTCSGICNRPWIASRRSTMMNADRHFATSLRDTFGYTPS